jgi:hypothetical protein
MRVQPSAGCGSTPLSWASILARLPESAAVVALMPLLQRPCFKGFDDPIEKALVSARCTKRARALQSGAGYLQERVSALIASLTPALAKKANLIAAIDKGSAAHAHHARNGRSRGALSVAVMSSPARVRRRKTSAASSSSRGQGHGFFNFNLSFEMYEATLMSMDEFLVELGFIEPDPESGLGKFD